MALTAFQQSILPILAKNRNPNSHFGRGPRLSDDFDIFSDSPVILAASVVADLKSLEQSGYDIDRRFNTSIPTHHFSCNVSKGINQTSLDWSCDTIQRFFPAIPDADFGWRLSKTDLAVNKMLALAGRREARDYMDIITLHQSGWTIATLANAAPGKDAGFTPQLILDEITRNSRFSVEELKSVRSIDPVDPVTLKQAFLQGVAEARKT
jgi:hypothetical protein